MKKTDEKIIQYLEGLMSPDQIKEFETELTVSEDLRKRLTEYRKVYSEVYLTKQKSLHPQYSDSIIPEFRRRFDDKNSRVFTKQFAYALVSFILIASALYLVNNLNIQNPDFDTFYTSQEIEDSDIELLINNLTDDEIILAYKDSRPEKIDSFLSTHYAEEVTSSVLPEENLFALNDMNFHQIENLLSDEELDIVYNEIFNKVFF